MGLLLDYVFWICVVVGLFWFFYKSRASNRTVRIEMSDHVELLVDQAVTLANRAQRYYKAAMKSSDPDKVREAMEALNEIISSLMDIRATLFSMGESFALVDAAIQEVEELKKQSQDYLND